MSDTVSPWARWEASAGLTGSTRAGTVILVGLLVLTAAAVGIGVAPTAAGDGGVESAAVDDDAEVAATFNATGTEGFVAIDQHDAGDPIQFPTPEEVDQPISIEGVVFTNGTWQSTDVAFPDLGEEQLGFDIDILLDAPRPFEGELDRSAGEMTVDAELNISVPAADEQIAVRANLTTGQSGDMVGTSEGLDTDSATLTLVGNEFTVPEETGDTLIDGFVGLPAPEVGTNWFSLTLSMDIETSTGTVAGVVESVGGDPVEGATVSGGDRETTTDADGSYEFEVPVGTQAVTVEAFGFADATESVSVGDGETSTVDVDFEPVDTGTVAGVVESADGDPVEGATVSVGDRETTTDADGSYDLAAEAGTDDLTVTAEGFVEASQSVVVEADTESAVDVELDPSDPSFVPVHVFASDATVGETVAVTAFVQNAGPVGGTDDVTVAVGEESVTESVELGPGQLGTVSLQWGTTAGDEGSYEASVTVGDESAATAVLVEGPAFGLDVTAGDAAPGETVTATATVENTGEVMGARTVTLSLVDEAGTTVASATESVELGPGERDEVTLEWPTTDDDAGSYEVVVEAGEETATGRVLVDESVGEADFVVESTGGYMAYGYDSLADAAGEGLQFPDRHAGEEPIRIWGVIDETEGTWESIRTEFPTLEQQGLEGTVETPNGVHGEIDREAGIITATATYRVVVAGDEDTSFTFNMTMTTAGSGEMTDIGAYEPVNDTFSEATFVGNGFPVTDQTGDSLADSVLNLPSPEPTENYMELGFDVDYDIEDQPDTDEGTDTDESAVETEPVGTTVATLGQGVGLLGFGGVVLLALGGLYARVTRVDTDVEPTE